MKQKNGQTKKFPKLNANILGVVRDQKFIFLKKSDFMKFNDKAYVVINSFQMNETLAAFGHNEKISNKILIIGGGNIGFNLAKNIEKTFTTFANLVPWQEVSLTPPEKVTVKDVLVQTGQKVKKGQIVGTLGQSGRATGPHLDIRLNWFDTRLDPMSALKLNEN